MSRTVTAVPFSRISTAKSTRTHGALAGTLHLKLYTAGASGANLEIPGRAWPQQETSDACSKMGAMRDVSKDFDARASTSSVSSF